MLKSMHVIIGRMMQLKLLCLVIFTLIIQCNADAVDNEISELSERLFDASTPNILSRVKVNLQGRTTSSALTDEAPAPLLTVSNASLSGIATIVKMRALWDNYEANTMTVENVTPSELREEDEFIDEVLDTAVMKMAMTYLQQKGSVRSDRASQKNLLKTLWFTLYSRGGGKVGSCAFEHVFMNEIKGNEISGLHNWIYFAEEERDSRQYLDYKGYMKSLHLGNKAQIIKYRMSYKNESKPVSTMFIGTLPELEMALYTVCHEAKKIRCEISLGGKKIVIRVYPFFYRGKRLIGSAFPQF
ncbi:poly(U)-specific endoribonuclease homolog [Contarinia nasturtii]|uniref:poly(U)-specific endoribonuclease homolog n=1 Tax=Contarinia nasturtii TaxID=265458 RepID=UPI0012D4B0C0|nr:poly(U)-specific endoribonuclease homolog [Contarinia nasturtii]